MGDVPMEFPWPWGKLDGSTWMIWGYFFVFLKKPTLAQIDSLTLPRGFGRSASVYDLFDWRVRVRAMMHERHQ